MSESASKFAIDRITLNFICSCENDKDIFMSLQTIKKLNLNLFQAHNSIQCDCRYYIALQWHFSDRIVVLCFLYWFTDFFQLKKSDREGGKCRTWSLRYHVFPIFKVYLTPFSADEDNLLLAKLTYMGLYAMCIYACYSK